MQSTAEKTLTPSEVATRLGKSRRSVQTLIARGEIRATDERVSLDAKPRYRIAESEIERWKQSRTVVPTQPVEQVKSHPMLKGAIRQMQEVLRQRRERTKEKI